MGSGNDLISPITDKDGVGRIDDPETENYPSTSTGEECAYISDIGACEYTGPFTGLCN